MEEMLKDDCLEEIEMDPKKMNDLIAQIPQGEARNLFFNMFTQLYARKPIAIIKKWYEGYIETSPIDALIAHVLSSLIQRIGENIKLDMKKQKENNIVGYKGARALRIVIDELKEFADFLEETYNEAGASNPNSK